MNIGSAVRAAMWSMLGCCTSRRKREPDAPAPPAPAIQEVMAPLDAAESSQSREDPAVSDEDHAQDTIPCPEEDLAALSLSPDPASLLRAHGILLARGYSFVGYHGCSMAAAESIVRKGFDPERAGSGMGLARGRGFYVARRYALAADAADSVTQAGDPDWRTGEIPRYSGAQGIGVVLRIYAREFPTMKRGEDYTWGVLSSDGDPNQDKMVRANDTTSGLEGNMQDLEVVFRTGTYPRLAAMLAMPAAEEDAQTFGASQSMWRSHEAPPRRPGEGAGASGAGQARRRSF